MSERKKITAAVSAVMSYLEEEAAASVQATAPEIVASAARTAPVAPVSFWGTSGRQAQMQMRNLMQLKAFHRIR